MNSNDSESPITVEARGTKPISLAVWLFLLCWPVVLSTVVLLWSQHQTEQAIKAAVAEMPKVAVVDELQLLQMVIDSGVDQTDARAMMAGVEQLIVSAGLGDTVVVSQSMVMYAPESARISARRPEPRATLEMGP